MAQVVGTEHRTAAIRDESGTIAVTTSAGVIRARSLGEAIDIARNDMGEFLLPAQRPGRPWGLLVQVAEVQASYGDWPGFPGPPNRKPDPSPVTRIRRRWHDSGP